MTFGCVALSVELMTPLVGLMLHCSAVHYYFIYLVVKVAVDLAFSVSEKLKRVEQICKDVGVQYEPSIVDGVAIVPLRSWYHSSWDHEPEIEGAVPIDMVVDLVLIATKDSISLAVELALAQSSYICAPHLL